MLIRQVQSTDTALLADGFTPLSPQSRQMRFLMRKKELTPAELRYFTDAGHHDHEALGALNHAGGRGVGIARYIRHAEDPYAAEIAVTIVDDWQGQELGTGLLTRLTGGARQEGIHRFTALVADDDIALAGLLRKVLVRAGTAPWLRVRYGLGGAGTSIRSASSRPRCQSDGPGRRRFRRRHG